MDMRASLLLLAHLSEEPNGEDKGGSECLCGFGVDKERERPHSSEE